MRPSPSPPAARFASPHLIAGRDGVRQHVAWSGARARETMAPCAKC
jgi:hypothetical protein